MYSNTRRVAFCHGTVLFAGLGLGYEMKLQSNSSIKVNSSMHVIGAALNLI